MALSVGRATRIWWNLSPALGDPAAFCYASAQNLSLNPLWKLNRSVWMIYSYWNVPILLCSPCVNDVPLSISTIGTTSTPDNSTPIPTEPVIGLAVIECAARLSSSSTPSASNTFSSFSSDSRKSFAKSTLHKFNKKWLCDPEFYDQNLNLNIFYVHLPSRGVLFSISLVHPELGK